MLGAASVFLLADATQPPLPESWVALAGFVVLLAFQGIQTWQNLRLQTSAVKTQKSAVKTEAQVTNGGSNLADVVGKIDKRTAEMARRTELMETYFDNLPNQHDIAGLRTDIRGLVGRVEKLETTVRSHHPGET